MAAGYPFGRGKGLSNVPEVRAEEAGFADYPLISLLFVKRPRDPALAFVYISTTLSINALQSTYRRLLL